MAPTDAEDVPWYRANRLLSPDHQHGHVQQCPTPQTAHIQSRDGGPSRIRHMGGLSTSVSRSEGLQVGSGEQASPTSVSTSPPTTRVFPKPLDPDAVFDEGRFLKEQRRATDIDRNMK
ncbi:hypothetical protein PQX77_007955, partial [Marasmius sp. AFHP31]